MALQAICGEILHIETAKLGRTVQAWIEDGRHITHVMLDEDQAVELMRKLGEAMAYELHDA